MISLETASIINGVMTRIFEDGESEFLTNNATKHITHQISKCMEELYSEFTVFSKAYIDGKDIIKSLKVDGKEVVGIKKEQTHYNYSYDKFYVDNEKIISLATSASFGKGTETILDENVRKALEIKEDRIEISYKNFNIFNKTFKDFVPKNKKFDFKLYKMHIYTEGGKFTKHKDTIHAANHYATLVVFIPETTFCGGDLVLYDQKDNVIVSCKSCSLLFLTNIVHEVKEISKGTRIVLQYDVYLEDEDEYEDKCKDEYDSEEDYGGDCRFSKPPKLYLSDTKYIDDLKNGIENKLLIEVDKFVKDNPNDEICFLLSQEYPLAINVKNLKSSDITLYETLLSKYNVEIGYVVNNIESNYCDTYENTDILNVMSYSDKKRMLVYFDELIGIKTNINDIKRKENVHIFIANGNFTQVKSKDYIEHTGNEASPAEYSYVSIVLCLGDKK